MATVTSNDILGTGRRKTSVARVRVRPGEGKIKINNRPLEEYFCNVRQRNAVVAPLEQTGKRAQLDVLIRVDGGGITGQADACKLGIARALKKMDEQAAVGLRRLGPLDPRRPHERAEEVRPSRRPPRHAVLETVIQRRAAARGYAGKILLSRPLAAVLGVRPAFTFGVRAKRACRNCRGAPSMLHRLAIVLGIVVSGACSIVATTVLAELPAPAAIVCLRLADPTEMLAAKEIRRYVYLRTGELLPILRPRNNFEDLATAPQGGLIVVSQVCTNRMHPLFKSNPDLEKQVRSLAREQYVLKTIRRQGRPILVVTASGNPLNAAYRLAEHLGVRFYLHGDVLPDKHIPLEMPNLNETRKPLFALRGIQPFHDFPEGPDWWSPDGYKAVIGQLPKMGMNFIGLHCYPEGGVGPEPLVWIGPPQDISPDGKVKASYPARHFTAANVTGAWGYRPGKTGDYVFGADQLFDCDDYAADVHAATTRRGTRCRPKSATPCSTGWAAFSATCSRTPAGWASRHASARRRRW